MSGTKKGPKDAATIEEQMKLYFEQRTTELKEEGLALRVARANLIGRTLDSLTYKVHLYTEGPHHPVTITDRGPLANLFAKGHQEFRAKNVPNDYPLQYQVFICMEANVKHISIPLQSKFWDHLREKPFQVAA